ncbi:DUF3135 domain-containing protein [Aromatoleum diolicum]|uniref:DUF3135 domain-containing protein n=1 Tax=Aromatoleum diolicum TaxID=75796 RepID=A0ABX1Q7Z2_9RHOO|nr:DUF3135 domain-containing protein [Aromatoleum diolicum]NMG74484.1 DUF3135 domain-containing protein [Aromatoleum diolicum]
MSEFDFDRWRELAERDPEAFFRARRRAIEHLIDSYPPGRREYLRDMQRHIDCVRACAGTPVKALHCLAAMMQDRLVALQHQNELLRGLAVKLRHSVGVDEVPG